MRPTLVLFDLDGTLLDSGAAGRRGLERALDQHGAGRTADFSFAGMTDRAIVREALRRAGLPSAPDLLDDVLAAYLVVLPEEVARAEPYAVHDGVLEALDAIERSPLHLAGLGTGNLRRGAEIKLERVGLAHRFLFGGFGSDSEDRAVLLRTAAERGARLVAKPIEHCRLVVVGDTPLDIAAAKAIGAESVAIATGPVPLDMLRRHHPDGVFGSLADPGAIDALLGSPGR